MRGALVIIGDAGEVDHVSITAETDEDVDLVRQALVQWQRAAQADGKTAPAKEASCE
jgi:hypothetical protein